MLLWALLRGRNSAAAHGMGRGPHQGIAYRPHPKGGAGGIWGPWPSADDPPPPAVRGGGIMGAIPEQLQSGHREL